MGDSSCRGRSLIISLWCFFYSYEIFFSVKIKKCKIKIFEFYLPSKKKYGEKK